MFRPNALMLVTAGTLAIVVSFPAFAGAASNRTAFTTEFSAENKDDGKNKKAAPAKTVAPRQAPVRVAPSQPPRTLQRQVGPQGGGQKKFEVHKKFEAQKKFEPQKKFESQKKIGPVGGSNTSGPKTAHRTFTPRGNNSRVVSAAKIRGAPAHGAFRTSIRGRNYSVWRSGYRVRRGSGWRTFVALGALGTIAIGSADYYPYAYIDAPEDYCDGLTEDGCQLVWDDVETMEGDAVGQCVAYCPWQQ